MIAKRPCSPYFFLFYRKTRRLHLGWHRYSSLPCTMRRNKWFSMFDLQKDSCTRSFLSNIFKNISSLNPSFDNLSLQYTVYPRRIEFTYERRWGGSLDVRTGNSPPRRIQIKNKNKNDTSETCRVLLAVIMHEVGFHSATWIPALKSNYNVY